MYINNLALNQIILQVKPQSLTKFNLDIDSLQNILTEKVSRYRNILTLTNHEYTIRLTKHAFINIHMKKCTLHNLKRISSQVSILLSNIKPYIFPKIHTIEIKIKNIQLSYSISGISNIYVLTQNINDKFLSLYTVTYCQSIGFDFVWTPIANLKHTDSICSLRFKSKTNASTFTISGHKLKGTGVVKKISEFTLFINLFNPKND
jgi:hypothetical protein